MKDRDKPAFKIRAKDFASPYHSFNNYCKRLDASKEYDSPAGLAWMPRFPKNVQARMWGMLAYEASCYFSTWLAAGVIVIKGLEKILN